jgi:hypothetical protein
MIQKGHLVSKARALARYLRAQQQANWEQLWNAKKALLYYYNLSTGVIRGREC